MDYGNTNPDPTDTQAEQASSPDGNATSPDGLELTSPVLPGGFQIPVIQFTDGSGAPRATPPVVATVSPFSQQPAIRSAELIELAAESGQILYYPNDIPLEPGDVLYLRERGQGETGVIVQVIKRETATYAQVGSKVIWRLLTKVRAQELQRTFNEPAEVIDLFLAATVKIRASIINGQWRGAERRIVTRNVDIFQIDPRLLLQNVLTSSPPVNVHVGSFKGKDVIFSGQGFDKINLVTGMKGAGKSYLTKGIIIESWQRGMTSVIFDINDEYRNIHPQARVYRPGIDLKFRLDRMDLSTLLEIIDRIAPFAERTAYLARPGIERIYVQRRATQNNANQRYLDIQFLIDQADIVIPNNAQYTANQRASYVQSLEALQRSQLFATAAEMQAEDNAMHNNETATLPTLRSVFHGLGQQGQAGIIVFSIGGLIPTTQKTIVTTVLDTLKTICDLQTATAATNPNHIPVYPTVFFEEAHMYMDAHEINELIPVIRHLGMNLFFITNTPGELPDSVFRLLDNLIMLRTLNSADIQCAARCGLTDKETIESFAPEMPDRHALIVSAKEGVTKNFPLIFAVRAFPIPPSGVTRSMWARLDQITPQTGGSTTATPDAAPENLADDAEGTTANQ